MKTKAEIAQEIIELNEQYVREYREAVARDPDGHFGLQVAGSDDPEVLAILWDRGLDSLYEAGQRFARRRNRVLMSIVVGSGDLSFGMAELVER